MRRAILAAILAALASCASCNIESCAKACYGQHQRMSSYEDLNGRCVCEDVPTTESK